MYFPVGAIVYTKLSLYQTVADLCGNGQQGSQYLRVYTNLVAPPTETGFTAGIIVRPESWTTPDRQLFHR